MKISTVSHMKISLNIDDKRSLENACSVLEDIVEHMKSHNIGGIVSNDTAEAISIEEFSSAMNLLGCLVWHGYQSCDNLWDTYEKVE